MAQYIDNISYNHEQGYDVRCVDLYALHNISTEHINVLLNNINFKGDHLDVLDVGCGDGRIVEVLLSHYDYDKVDIYALDVCKRICDEIYHKLMNVPNISIYHDDIKTINLDKKFDYIIVKNVLHEISFGDQKQSIIRMNKHLKKNGQILLWDFFLYEDTVDFVRSVVKFKDELCGYTKLVEDREFIAYNDLRLFLFHHGFRIEEIYSYNYKFSTLRQLKYEGKLNKTNLCRLNTYIRKLSSSLSEQQKRRIHLYDNLNDCISFIMNCKIILINKIDE